VLDYRSGRAVAFASNEKMLALQQGTFEAPGLRPGANARRSATKGRAEPSNATKRGSSKGATKRPQTR
jgi:hypothetical protein